MKLEGLAILFIIIILPISVVLSEYTKAQVETLSMQSEYDNRLNNATYDGIKAFQLNTYNSDTSSLANSKIRDIEASANTFYNSVASNFKMEGYNKDMLSGYVPALVYTMYDGYYIYSEYYNTLVEEQNNTKQINTGEKTTGLKPYIYYSARFKNYYLDVVITYSLDNYVTIQGIKGINTKPKPINISGYVVDDIKKDPTSGNIEYNEVVIEKEVLSEFVGNTSYDYVKKNGVKYYYDFLELKWFSMIGDKKYYTTENFSQSHQDQSAYDYYSAALELQYYLGGNGILDLTVGDMQDRSELFDGMEDLKIFDYENNIEEPDSNFNLIRETVIRDSIEKNLSVAIANYNAYAGNISTNFVMPKLKEDEWPVVSNNVCLISFMQGLSIGGKIYNGYSIVPNNKTKEVVKENSIYIGVGDTYYKPNDKALMNLSDIDIKGISKLDFERKSMLGQNPDGTYSDIYYYPNKALGSYTSIVSASNIDMTHNNIFDYLESDPNNQKLKSIKKAYYTALGRERYKK